VLVREMGGIRVGFFSLTTDYQPQDYVTYGFAPEVRRATVTAALAALERMGAELVVALTHQDVREDLWLAREFPGIGLVVGGHEHTFQLHRAGRTWITKGDADARTVVRIDVRRGSDGLLEMVPTRITVDRRVAPDPTVAAEVEQSLAQLSRTVRERALGNFLTDVIRERMASDVAFVNGGAIRINDDIPAGGALRVYELDGIFYYDNRLVSVELSGAELLGLLRASIAGADTGHGRFLQVSGIRFRYHPLARAAEPEDRIKASDVEVKPRGAAVFEPLDLARRYRAATLDYLWQNGYREGYPLFSAGAGGSSPPRVDGGALVSWREATEAAIARLPGGRVTSSIEGRIIRATP
jgi:5'-nucleotidase